MSAVRVRSTSLVSGVRRGREGNVTDTTRFAGLLGQLYRGGGGRQYCTNYSWSLSQPRRQSRVNLFWNTSLEGGNVNGLVRNGCRALSTDAFHWTGGANNRVRVGEVVVLAIGSTTLNMYAMCMFHIGCM